MRNYFLKYDEFLNESLSSARKKYYDLLKDDWEIIVSIDPTPTKKYLEKICEWELEGINMDLYTKYIKKFHNLLPKIEQKDINKYGSFEEFKEMLDGIESNTAKKKEIKKGIKVVLETDRVQITQPQTYEQSCILGAGTKWCTTSEGNEFHWNKYINVSFLTFYYIWFKDKPDYFPFYKVAVGVDPNGYFSEIYDAKDEEMDDSTLYDMLEEYDIHYSIFVTRYKNFPSINTLQKSKLEELFSKDVLTELEQDTAKGIIIDNLSLRTEENLEKFFSYSPLPVFFEQLITVMGSWRTPENFKKWLSLNPTPNSIVRNIIQWDEFKVPENFEIFMKLNKSKYNISTMSHTPGFKEWYELNYEQL